MKKLDPENLQYVQEHEAKDLEQAVRSYRQELSDLQKVSLLLGTSSTYSTSSQSLHSIKRIVGIVEV